MKHFFCIVVATFSLASCLWAEPTVKSPFCGHCLNDWSRAKSNQPDVWTIGTVTVSDKAPKSFVVSQVAKEAVPCMVNAVPGDWHQKPRQGVDIYTKEVYGDCTVKLEFMVTQGSNSGVYLMGEYEVQISDSFGKKDDQLNQGDMGAIYSAAAPKVNAAAKPGAWQKYEIDFVAPKFDATGQKTANARFKKIVLNGVTVQEDIEVKGPTGGGLTMKEKATGPLMLQGNHGPIAVRNIEVIVP